MPGGENSTGIFAVRVLVESRGAAAGINRANHCTNTGGPHWAPHAEIVKMAEAALVRLPTRRFATKEGDGHDDGVMPKI